MSSIASPRTTATAPRRPPTGSVKVDAGREDRGVPASVDGPIDADARETLEPHWQASIDSATD